MINVRVTSTILVGKLEDKFEQEATISTEALKSQHDVIENTFAAMMETLNKRVTRIDQCSHRS